MRIVQFVGGALVIIVFLSIIVGWIFYLIQWILCRKKVNCDNENCKFRSNCIHEHIRRKEQIKFRIEILEERMKNKTEEEEKL